MSVVVVVTLKPQLLNFPLGEALQQRITVAIATAANGGPVREDPVEWLRINTDGVKVVPEPALLSLAVFLARRGVRVVVDQSRLTMVPGEREKLKSLLLQPDLPEHLWTEEPLRLMDFLYLEKFAGREKPSVVILPLRPRGSAERIKRLNVIELDFLGDDPLDTFRRSVETVPFRAVVKVGSLTTYTIEETLLKFWKQLTASFKEMKRHLFALFKSGVQPKSQSRPMLEHVPAALNNIQALKFSPAPEREASQLAEASAACGEFAAFAEYLRAATPLFHVPVPRDVNPYLQISSTGDLHSVCLVNPSDRPLVNLKIEYLNESSQVMEFSEVATLQAYSSMEIGPDELRDLREMRVVALRLKQTNQSLRLP